MNKYISTFIFSFTILLIFSQKLDTIYSYNKNVGTSFQFYPIRAHSTYINELGDERLKVFIDSIRPPNFKIINKYHKPYYLKSYGKDSVLRVEGEFFDCYPSKNIIEYDVNGDTLTYGHYKIVKRKKPKSVLRGRKVGKKTVIKWKSYYYCYKDGEWISYDKQRDKINQTFYDIPNKRIKKIIYRTNLGKLKKVEVVKKIKRKDYIINLP